MYLIHQIVGVIADPIVIAILGIAVGGVKRWRGRVALLAILVFLWIYSMPVTSWWVTKWLESGYPVMRAEEMPEADAILVLGGGIGRPKEPCSYPYADLGEAADRVWHAARLWHAQVELRGGGGERVGEEGGEKRWRGREGLKIYCTNREVSKSTPPFLMDLGVPREAIVPLDGPRNTEEEARLYEAKVKVEGGGGDEVELRGGGGESRWSKEVEVERRGGGERKVRVLLVTSATHMRRAEMIFRKYAPSLEVIPAATDYHSIESDEPEFDIRRYLPSVSGAMQMSAVMHEILGIARYAMW